MAYSQNLQSISGILTYYEAIEINNNNQKFLLRARDSCGLEVTTNLVFQFKVPLIPPYIYEFRTSDIAFTDFNVRLQFFQKLVSYNGASFGSIGLLQLKTNKITYFNCSIQYDPCDCYQLDLIRKTYSTEIENPLAAFKTHMLPIEIFYASTDIDKKCLNPLNPELRKAINPITTSLCFKTIFQIPADTFYDYKQGPTRNLVLSLSYSQTNIFNPIKYTQFQSQTQTLYVIPTVSMLENQGSNGFSFIITATNQQNLQRTTQLNMKIRGSSKILKECKIIIVAEKLSQAAKIRSNFDTMTYFVDQLSVYFKITKEEIGIVDFQIKNDKSFEFSWSYCSNIYKSTQYLQDDGTLSIDSTGLQNKILKMLFQQDRKSIQPNFKSTFSNEYNIESVVTQFTGRCQNLPPIPSVREITISISYGGYYTHNYKEDYFYDYEDGGAYSLNLLFLNSGFQQVLIDHWVNIDLTKKSIIAVMYDQIRFSTNTRFTYYLQAIDQGGLSGIITVILIRDQITYAPAPFNFVYYLQYTGQPSSIYVNQSSYIIQSIISFFNSVSNTRNIITTMNLILVRRYAQIFGYPQYRVITYTLANQDCNSKILEYMKTVYSSQG